MSTPSQSPPVVHRKTTQSIRDNVKYIIVTGGTVSGLGKGTAISSIGVVLKSAGYRLTAIKVDPYLNIDAGTMSPFEHGEVYVLEDGGEADLDLGNYERFLNITLSSSHNLTTGKIYSQILKRERAGEYLGKTVQIVPHVTDAIQDWISNLSLLPVDGSNDAPEICLVELGGTVGDIESSAYLEALQQFQFLVGPDNFAMVHVGYVPNLGEQKTKTIQHSVRLLREAGLKPDVILCRSESPLEESTRRKIGLFCQVGVDQVLSMHDVTNLYKVPLLLGSQGILNTLQEKLDLNRSSEDGMPLFTSPLKPRRRPSSSPRESTIPHGEEEDFQGLSTKYDYGKKWIEIATNADSRKNGVVRIGLVGKYTGLTDSYQSVLKALEHSAIALQAKLQVKFIDSSEITTTTVNDLLGDVDGVLCPGGFGDRGVEGKCLSARFCRQNRKLPFFGICLGLQCVVIDYCRDVLALANANSAEFDDSTTDPVVIFMPEISTTEMGGTMRLGTRGTKIESDTLAHKIYGGSNICYERHRHRYEVNPIYAEKIEEVGDLIFSGKDSRGVRMEIVEAVNCDWFVATQFHPEFTSRPLSPNPVFLDFVKHSLKYRDYRM